VRVSGGAYGAFCQLGQRSGTVQLLSYRDPNVMATYDVFARAGDALVDIVSNMSDDDLELAVIGAIGDLDSPLSADQKGFESFLRWAAGETPEHRLAWRAQVHSLHRSHLPLPQLPRVSSDCWCVCCMFLHTPCHTAYQDQTVTSHRCHLLFFFLGLA
jgi:Zn-dependent M16 (insulinase) family peptidase